MLAAVLGLICGSFVTALSYRLPRGQDFVSGRSKCPNCETSLTIRDLVPVFSWLFSGGRCRHCAVKVSARYPLTEVICSALFVVVVVPAQADELTRLAVMWLLTISLLSLTIIDLELRKLPNGLVLFVSALCALLAWLDERTVQDVVAMVLAALLLGLALRWLGQILSSQNGVGWGDVKLAAALAVALNVEDLSLFLAVMGIFALGQLIWWSWRHPKTGVPLGPALCAGAFASLV